MDARTANDSSWVKSLFNGVLDGRDERFLALRRYSNGMLSFEDTTLGGSKAINTPPQFTWFADPPSTGAFAQPDNPRAETKTFSNNRETGSYKLGTYFYESINQNSFYVHCRFGKPKYLGMAAFFANMYDSNLAYLARTGDYPGMMRTMVSYLGAAAIWATVGTVAFAVILITPRILKAVLNKQTSRYYYVKPTMHLYLRAVQNILNTQLIYRRLVPTGVLGNFKLQENTDDGTNSYSNDKQDWYASLPTIWKDNGEFDVYRMINRYQTLANYQTKAIEQMRIESGGDEEAFARKLRAFYNEGMYSKRVINDAGSFEVSLHDLETVAQKDNAYKAPFENINDQESKLVEGITGTLTAGGTADEIDANTKKLRESMAANMAAAEKAENEIGGEDVPDIAKIQEWADTGSKENVGTFFKDFVEMGKNYIDGIKENALSEIRNGSQWVSWRIDAKDTVSRSFSNSTKEPEISGTVNSLTAKARSLEVNLSGGQTGFSAVDALVSGIKSAMRGVADTLHLTGIMSLYNSSVIDFPEVWDSSDASGDDITLTIPLRCWSGNDLDIFQDLLVPLSFWIAAVCPLATGKQSFTHPFYLECYSQGRFSFRNAMVTSMSLQFGVGGLGWRPGDSVPLSCDISVTIRDLTRVMYMPIVTDTGVWDDDNKFSEFMACLGGATLYERTNGIARAKINASIWAQNWASAWSQGSFINSALDVIPARQIANIFLPQAR
ncbi:hypothetical protein ACFXH4_000079 [Shigella flexneri]|nr:hypothetical protein [Salmonella enterica]